MDGLRLVCFLGVLFFHEGFERYWYAAHGLPAFFALSGFLITRVLLEGEPRGRGRVLYHFYVRRALRIVPIYYLLLLALVAVGRLPHPGWYFGYLFNFKVYEESLKPFVELPPGVLPYNCLHLWSLAVEEQFYIGYPLLLLWTRPSRRVPLLWLLLGACIGTRLYLRAAHPNAFVGALPFVSGEHLLWGCLAYLLHARGTFARLDGRWLVGVAVAAILAMDLGAPATGEPAGLVMFRPTPRQTFYAVAVAALVWGLWKDERSWLTRALAWGPCAYLGRISYGLYLFHPFAWGLWRHVVDLWPVATILPLPMAHFALTAVAASVAWRYVEAPVQALKVRFPLLNSEPGSPAAPPARWAGAEPERAAG